MIKHYIIDGNNVLGKLQKHPEFKKTNKKDSRSRLAFIIDRYFMNKKVIVTLHFDGHKTEAIKVSKLRIDYSENKTADDWIKHEIMVIKNPKTICVVTSDNNVAEFARVSMCKSVKSEEFVKDIMAKTTGNEEEKIIKSIDDEEMKRLFGIK